MKWFEILEEVSFAKGKEKVEVLKKHKDAALLPEILNFLYNPRIVTGISKKKMGKELEISKTVEIPDENHRVASIMEYLHENNTGKDQDLIFVKSIIESTDDMKERQFLESLVVKDMPIGISANSVNKVWPKLIPVFKLQKGQLFEGSFEGPQIVSLKIDGNSATVFNLEEKTYMLSRSGAIMEGFDHILNYYRHILPFGYVYQGELIAKNYNNLDHGELFRYSNGITNSKKNDEKTMLQHVVFDVIPIKDFENGKSDMVYVDRLSIAQSCVEEYQPYGETYKNVCVVPVYAFTENIERIMEAANDKIRLGLEGLMICTGNSIYKKGKQKWLQKIKEFNTMDLEVVDLKEHVRGGKVGALIVKYKENEIGVGGITEDLRVKWWNNPNEIIGKIVEVKYFRSTEDKNGKESLRFPTFVRVREDKFEESFD
ncbi:DNA ligase, phage-associated [Enterococcus phage VFW]|nr:DNA ligase, phage-associated [Enterococcus phage VFW]